jgi:hypothetical protein
MACLPIEDGTNVIPDGGIGIFGEEQIVGPKVTVAKHRANSWREKMPGF